jgi:hypothetical protein
MQRSRVRYWFYPHITSSLMCSQSMMMHTKFHGLFKFKGCLCTTSYYLQFLDQKQYPNVHLSRKSQRILPSCSLLTHLQRNNISSTPEKRQMTEGKVYGDITSNENSDYLVVGNCQGWQTQWDNQRWIPELRSPRVINHVIMSPSKGIPLQKSYPVPAFSCTEKAVGTPRLSVLLQTSNSSALHWASLFSSDFQLVASLQHSEVTNN